MSEMKIHKGIAYEGVEKVIRARVKNASEQLITQAAVTAVTFIVDQYNSEEEAELDQNPTSIIVETSAGAVSSVIFNSLQPWDEDDEGYNVQVTLPPSAFPTGDKWARGEVWIDPTSGNDFPGGIWILYVTPTTRD